MFACLLIILLVLKLSEALLKQRHAFHIRSSPALFKHVVQKQIPELFPCLPHEVSEVTWRNVALARSVKPLESRIRLKRLAFAKVLTTKLDFLLVLANVGQKLGQLLLSAYRHILALHHLYYFI